MILHDVGMLLVLSSRSRAYLQTLVHHDLLPSYVIVMDDESDTICPGQLANDKLSKDGSATASGGRRVCMFQACLDPDEPIPVTLDKAHIPYEICPTRDVNSAVVIERVRARKEACFIYSGIGGAVLREGILGTGKRFLHVHPGRVPDFRGSTTVYYSLLKEGRAGATAFFLDEDIDTGDLLKNKEYAGPGDGTLVDYVYDPCIRADLLLDVLRDYVSTGEFRTTKQDRAGGETYFIIHPVLKHIAILSCGRGC